MLAEDPLGSLSPKPKRRLGWKTWSAGGILVLTLIATGYLVFRGNASTPKEAPEANEILAIQANLPFQVLIPAFLPRGFDRSQAKIDTGGVGPDGAAMLQLTYPGRNGITLTVKEWLSPTSTSNAETQPANGSANTMAIRCRCQCISQTECTLSEVEVQIGSLTISFNVSPANLLSMQEMQLILKTLGPAANSQIFSAIEDVPLSYTAPPGVEIPINPQGVQELTLIVSPQGYNPAHFIVKQGVPVRLTFRQLGQVGCGNELVFPQGNGKEANILLSSADDQKVIEFTPEKSGDYLYHCPHMIYQGLMTVNEP